MKSNPIDLSGRWNIEVTYGKGYEEHVGKTLICDISLVQNGKHIRGEAIDISGFGVSPNKAEIKGTLIGDKLSFIKRYDNLHFIGENEETIIDESQIGWKINYSGFIHSDGTIEQGTWSYKRRLFGLIPIGNMGQGTWKMRRSFD